jgi:hypothetical protein
MFILGVRLHCIFGDATIELWERKIPGVNVGEIQPSVQV